MPLLQDGRSIFEENSFNSQFRVKREKLYYYKKIPIRICWKPSAVIIQGLKVFEKRFFDLNSCRSA